MKEIFRIRNFRLLWLSQLMLSLGDGLMQMGLLELFVKYDYDKRVELSKMGFAIAVPGLLLGPLTMALLGRWQRRSVMIVSDVVRAVLVMGICVWIMPLVTGQARRLDLFVVYLLIGVLGVVVTFYLPARNALLPNLVAAGQLIEANTLFAITLAVARFVGVAAGAKMAVDVGIMWAVLGNAVLSLVCVGVLWRIRMQPHATTSVADAPAAGRTWRDFREGTRYLVDHRNALPLVILTAVFMFLLAILGVVIIDFAYSQWNLTTNQLPWLFVVGGAGAGCGIGMLYFWPRLTKSDWVPAILLVTAGVALLMLAGTGVLRLAVLPVFVLGAVFASVLIYVDARLQAQVEDAYRGAVFAARGTLVSVTTIVGFWLQFGTDLFKLTPPGTVMKWLAWGSMSAAGLTFLILHHKTRHRRDDRPHDRAAV